MCLNDHNMMLWVSYNGSRKDNRKYQFSIEVVDEDDQMVLSCTKFCVPCDMSRDVIKDKFLGVVINKDLALEVNTGSAGNAYNAYNAYSAYNADNAYNAFNAYKAYSAYNAYNAGNADNANNIHDLDSRYVRL